MEKQTTKDEFEELGGREEPDPLERLRFFCSLAMKEQDWLDVEPFFDDIRGYSERVTLEDTVVAMAENGWLYFGLESMSEAQEKYYAIYLLVKPPNSADC